MRHIFLRQGTSVARYHIITRNEHSTNDKGRVLPRPYRIRLCCVLLLPRHGHDDVLIRVCFGFVSNDERINTFSGSTDSQYRIRRRNTTNCGLQIRDVHSNSSCVIPLGLDHLNILSDGPLITRSGDGQDPHTWKHLMDLQLSSWSILVHVELHQADCSQQ